MSSLIRRIERQVFPSQVIFPEKKGGQTVMCAHAPRKVYFNGRGRSLGHSNPKDASLLARLAREAKRLAQ